MSFLRALLCVSLAACSTSSTSPDASSDASPEASTALHANGSVGPWQTLSPLPTPRANFCATVVGSYIVAIGGNYPSDGGFTKLDEILVARFHDDGSLDPWTVAGHAPSPVTECTAAGSGNVLYLVDGIYDDASKQGHVFSGAMQSDGTVNVAEIAGTFPAGVDFFDDLAFASADRLFVVTSKLTGSCALDSVPLGVTPTWSDHDFFGEFRGRPQWGTASAGGSTFVYVLGGYSDADAGNVVLTTGAGAEVASDGNVGSSFPTTPLPKPTTFGMAASADDFVFVIGGRDQIFGGTPRNDVISAQATSSGALGAWSTQAPIPAGRSNGAVVVAGNFLYILGGASTSATDTVYAAQVRF